jgi:CubicO group peptidase (beta-lactamase class C family)
MRTLLCLLVTALIPGSAPTGVHVGPAGESPGVYRAVDTYLAARAAATRTPGMAYAVVSRDGVDHVGVYGKDGDDADVTAATPFLWGSVSKPVTAAAVMTLAEDGLLHLDDRVREHLPAFVPTGDGADRITVRHLLQHTSGLTDGAGLTDRFDDRPDPYGMAIADLAGTAPDFPPGEKHSYASTNYLVLGAVVEAVSGQSFATYLRERVLDPLGMDTAITTTASAGELTGGHRVVLGRPVGLAPRFDPAGPSYGYLGGSVEDLAHFAVAMLGEGTHPAGRILEPASAAQLLRGTQPVNGTQRYGLGWRDSSGNADLGTRTVWHGGAAPGYQAMIVLLPEAGRGIVVLQNLYGYFQDAELAAAGLGAARILAGGEPRSVSADATYPVLLGVLATTLAAMTAATAWSVARMFRPRQERRGRRRILLGGAAGVLVGLTLAWLAGLAVPGSVDAEPELIRLVAPDISALLTGLALSGLVFAAARTTGTALRYRRHRQVLHHPSRPDGCDPAGPVAPSPAVEVQDPGREDRRRAGRSDAE